MTDPPPESATMNAPTGYIKHARKMYGPEDIYWGDGTPFDSRSAWAYLIYSAAYASYRYRGVDPLERGEFVASVRYLAERWQWSKSRVSRWLRAAEKAGRIAGQRMGQHGMVYLLVNYDTYQDGPADRGTPAGTPSGTEVGQERDTCGTNKKEVKKKEKQSPPGLAPLTQSDVESVVAHYVRLHPKRRPGPKDRAQIVKALGFGYSAGELCEAITGNAEDGWAKGIKKHELGWTLRDNGQIDNYRAKATASADAVQLDDAGWYSHAA